MAMGNENDAALTPVMRQYFAAKAQHPDCLMFIRMGDFYELFYEDAILVSRELQLTLTARDKERKQPMCGVPYHAAEIYLQRLLRKGYRIALCEQMEDPKTVKGIVKREVTRVLTPGTAVDPGLGAGESCWLSSIVCWKDKVGVGLVDLSTGDLRAAEFSNWELAVDELGRMRPVELVYAAGGLLRASVATLKLGEAPNAGVAEGDAEGLDGIRTKTAVEDWAMTAEHALPLLRQQFRLHSLDGLGLGGHEAAAVAAGALVHYLRQTKAGALEHLEAVRFYERSGSLELDAVSVRNLELVEPLFSGESAQTTLLYTLDACCTPMGKRLLRATLLRAPGWHWGKLTHGSMRWLRRLRICASARVCGGRWMECWIWSGCWEGWRWNRPGHARCWRSPGRWGVCRVCVRRCGLLVRQGGSLWRLNRRHSMTCTN